MRKTILVALLLVGCKQAAEPETRTAVTAPVVAPVVAVPDARVAAAEPTWFRAVIRASDGVEARFLLGIPAANAPGQAVFRVGGHEVRSDATFDGKTLKIPLKVHQTDVDGTVGSDGNLTGTFSTSWRAWGASSIPLTGTKIAAPEIAALETMTSTDPVLDLKAPRSAWRIVTSDSGIAKLVLKQTAPGDFEGVLSLDTGNIIYLAGNGRGNAVVMTGFDGTSGYRVELAFDAAHAKARGKLFGGHRLDWRETLTATRRDDFMLVLKPKATRPGGKIGLPDLPALAALPPGPLVVEIAGSWCSTCRNAAPFLVEQYREYKPRGLQIVTLLYEFTDDPAIDAQQAETFKKTYGVTWPVVPVPGGIDNFADIMPSGLADLNPAGFPIMLFLSADRSLVALHAGFPAPADEEDFRRVAAEIRANLDTLVKAASK